MSIINFSLALLIISTLVVTFSSLLPQDSMAVATLIEIQSEKYYEDWTQKDNHGRAALVYFYAGWSPVCKVFTKEYGKVAKHFGHKDYQDVIMTTKMDGPNYPRLSRSLKLEKFPTVYLYSVDEVGKYEVYDGELEAEALIKWTEERIHKKMKTDGKNIPKRKKKRGIL